jgi:hypothetical protein
MNSTYDAVGVELGKTWNRTALNAISEHVHITVSAFELKYNGVCWDGREVGVCKVLLWRYSPHLRSSSPSSVKR